MTPSLIASLRRFSGWLGWALGLAAAASTALARNASEYRVKAAFLYNFTKFVEWPDNAAADRPFVLGVCGPGALVDELRDALAGRSVRSRPLRVAAVRTPADARAVDLLFVSAQGEDAVEDLLAAVRASPVLTVGESDRFAGAGGIITFLTVDGRVRFAIDRAAGERARLRISAQLLKLATARPKP